VTICREENSDEFTDPAEGGRGGQGGAAVSVSGVYGGEIDSMPMMEMFDRSVQLRMGQAHARRWIDDLLPIVGDDRDPVGVCEFATHPLPLEDAPRRCETFRDKADGCIKVVLQP
jgi:threonine dehydrogenase-like Zn-dependent dehydrogenase